MWVKYSLQTLQITCTEFQIFYLDILASDALTLPSIGTQSKLILVQFMCYHELGYMSVLAYIKTVMQLDQGQNTVTSKGNLNDQPPGLRLRI